MSYENGKRILWWIIGILTTIILSMCVAYLTLIRNVVTQDDLARQLSPVNEKVDKLIREQEAGQADISDIKTNVAVIQAKIAPKK